MNMNSAADFTDSEWRFDAENGAVRSALTGRTVARLCGGAGQIEATGRLIERAPHLFGRLAALLQAIKPIAVDREKTSPALLDDLVEEALRAEEEIMRQVANVEKAECA